MSFISLFKKSGKDKQIDESVLTDTFHKSIKERLIKCLSKSVLDLPIVVEESSVHSPNGREWLLITGAGYCIRDVAHLQGRLVKGFLVNLASEFNIGSTEQGQFCLSVLLDELQGQFESSGEVKWGTSLLVASQSVVYKAIEWIPSDVLVMDYEAVSEAYEGLVIRNLAKDLSDFFKDYPRLVEALSRLEAEKGTHLVSVPGGLKSILDKALQKDKPVLFDELYQRNTSNTFKNEAQ